MKKLLLMLGLMFSFATASFGQSLTVNPQPACSSQQSGSYSTLAVTGGGATDEIPLGIKLCGSYTTVTVTTETAIPVGTVFGIWDQTINAGINCLMSASGIQCSSSTSVTYSLGDNITFVAYTTGTGYSLKNLIWSLQ